MCVENQGTGTEGPGMHDKTLAGTDGLRAGRRQWLGLAVLALSTLVVTIDVYVMLLALPHVSADLGASSIEQLWIMDIYGFVLAGLLVTMGTLGDRIGRRKLLFIGAGAFAVASVVAAYSTSPEMLIAARALLGIAGATLAPSTMSLIRNLFPDPKQMGLAIGIWAMCFSVGALVGPLVGGAMLEHFWWGSVLLLGVPAMVLLLILGPALLPEYRDPNAGKVDITSVVLSFVAVLPVIYGLKELASDGWAVGPVASLLFGLAFCVVFALRQRRLSNPLLDLKLFRIRAFSTALGGMMFGTMLMGSIMLFITQDLQLVEGLSPLQAGLWMLPSVIANTVSFLVAPILARRFRPAYLIGGGLVISVVGLLILTQVDTVSGPLTLAMGFAVIFLGAGPLVTLGVNLVLVSVPPEKAGSAAALNETSGQFGYAFGIAALGSIGAAIYTNRADFPADLSAADTATATASLADATYLASQLQGELGAAVLNTAREAFVSGLHLVAAISAGLLAVVAVLTTTLLRHVPPTGTVAEPEETTEDDLARTPVA
jgi:DHA2 family multidrug resistance protein-like MFS transporter